MAKAKEAQQWAQGEFKGIMDTLYTPWTKDDEIDEEALRKEVRRILIDIQAEGVWYSVSDSEAYFMTMAEKKKMAEIVNDEIHKIKLKKISIGCVYADSAKDCVELINYSARLGADIVAIQTPRFLYGDEGILSWFGYVAEHTDIALCFFQRGPWMLSPSLIAKMAERWPAYCAIKNAGVDLYHSIAVTELSKGKVQSYNTNLEYILSGNIKKGKLAPVLNGFCSYRFQVAPELKFRDFWNTVLKGDMAEAAKKYYGYHLYDLMEFFQRYSQSGHGLHGVKMHHNALEKFWAAQLGMPMGSGGWQKCGAGSASVSKEVQDKLVALLKEAGLKKD